MVGTQSMPTGDPMTDPCPQNDAQCPSATFVAVTQCCAQPGPNCPRANVWNRLCQCIPRNGPTGAAGSASTAGGTCGDGVLQTAAPRIEECDPGTPGDITKPARIASTCTALNAGSGLLMCDPLTCRYDTSMCTPGGGNGGTGGT